MPDHLFNPAPYDSSVYGDSNRAIRDPKRKDPSQVVKWREPWVLLSNTRGVLGHHLVKGTTAGGSLLTECGKTGIKVGDGRSAQMVTCDDCAEERG